MLCCLAARNNFAHHDYRDEALFNEKSSGFLLGGVLLAMLTLLNGELIKPGPSQVVSQFEIAVDGTTGQVLPLSPTITP